jgi:hypothetical protein
LFRENAADLFPRKVQRQTQDVPLINPALVRHARRKRKNVPPHTARPGVEESLDPENFPEQIEQFAIDVMTFLNCLNEFPEFTDEAVNASIQSFNGDLKVCCRSLELRGLELTFRIVLGFLFEDIQK